jgi:23S rRNA (guanosine2251-2'-O)-methyltransferase
MKLYGKKALLDNIKNSKIVRLINNDKKIIDLLKLNNVNYEFVKKEYFNYLDKSLNHQGIEIETFENKKFENLEEFIKNQNEEKKSIVVILDSILDPYNLGSIIRTCESFKVDAIIYKKDNQVQINELVIKTSAGAIANISMIRVINLSSTIELLKKNKY